jgi:hypothetical protein
MVSHLPATASGGPVLDLHEIERSWNLWIDHGNDQGSAEMGDPQVPR